MCSGKMQQKSPTSARTSMELYLDPEGFWIIASLTTRAFSEWFLKRNGARRGDEARGYLRT